MKSKRVWLLVAVLILIVTGIVLTVRPKPLLTTLSEVRVDDEKDDKTFGWFLRSPKALNVVAHLNGYELPLEEGSDRGPAVHCLELMADKRSPAVSAMGHWYHDASGDEHIQTADVSQWLKLSDLRGCVVLGRVGSTLRVPCHLDLLKGSDGRTLVSVDIKDSPKSKEDLHPTVARIFRFFGIPTY